MLRSTVERKFEIVGEALKSSRNSHLLWQSRSLICRVSSHFEIS